MIRRRLFWKIFPAHLAIMTQRQDAERRVALGQDAEVVAVHDQPVVAELDGARVAPVQRVVLQQQGEGLVVRGIHLRADHLGVLGGGLDRGRSVHLEPHPAAMAAATVGHELRPVGHREECSSGEFGIQNSEF